MTNPSTPAVRLDLRADGLDVDGRLLPHPVVLADLDALLPAEVARTPSQGRIQALWAWPDLGMEARSADDVRSTLLIVHEPDVRGLLVEGRPATSYVGTRDLVDLGPDGELMVKRDGDGQIEWIGFDWIDPSPATAAAPAPAVPVAAGPVVPPPAAPGDVVEFADLNLKLAVVQVLMYERERLTPAFDVRAFVAGHSARRIDVDAEGHDPIPEVLAWFAALPVPAHLLAEVDDLFMDGGNEVYLEVAPRWSGEDGAFDIRSYDDLALLPNLASMTVMGADEATLAMLRERGIDAQPL